MNVKLDAPDVHEKWQRLFSFGDIEKILKQLPENERLTHEGLRKQFRSGKYRTVAALRAVSEYYKGKEAEIKEILKA